MDKQLNRDKKMHVVFMAGMIGVMLLGVAIIYLSIRSEQNIAAQERPEYVAAEEEPRGEVKPLPDYMLDDIKSNELEKLKP